MWQEKDECKSWCLTIGSCDAGRTLRLRKCGSHSNQKWWLDGDVLRPACSGSLYVSDGLVVRGSDASVDYSFSSSSGEFEIRKSRRCLTNIHHPRDKEEVKFRNCERARRSDTSKWEWV